ncbi:MAG: hypothetical protein ABW321_33410, partial [Polyangiales bacterium]
HWQCDPWQYLPQPELGVDPTAARHFRRREPSLGDAAAAPYARRALVLMPNDVALRCNAAQLELALGHGDEDLVALQSDAQAHLQLCHGLAYRAARGESPALFRQALLACNDGLQRERGHVELRNALAYTYRVWRVHTPWLDELERLSPVWGELAEGHARAAHRLLTSTSDEGTRSLVRSTLGEVLLARGRPHEAAKVLVEALNGSSTLPLLSRNEMRYDLLESCTCLEAENQRLRSHLPVPDACGREGQGLARIASAIRTAEELGELRPFSSAPETLDPVLIAQRCVDAPESLAFAQAPQASVCGFPMRQGEDFRAIVQFPKVEQAVLEQLSVHVWGPDIDLRRGPHPAGDAIHVPLAPADVPYFVQLWRGSQVVSPALAILPPTVWSRDGAGRKQACPSGLAMASFHDAEPPIPERLYRR